MFSVVIPLYNKEAYVKSTLASVLQQTFEDFEVLVVDDGSTDDSVSVVNSLEDSRIRVVSQTNSGVSSARNRGVVEAKHEFIAFLDADDVWERNYLEKMCDLINANPGCGMYGAGHRQVLNDGVWVRDILLPPCFINGQRLSRGFFEAIYSVDGFICSSAIVVPKRLFFKENIWFPVGEVYGEDQYVWGLIALNSSLAYVNEVLATYFVDSENNTSSIMKKKHAPSKCVSLIGFSSEVVNERERGYLKLFVERKIVGAILRNIASGYRWYALSQLREYGISWRARARCLLRIVLPKKIIRGAKVLFPRK